MFMKPKTVDAAVAPLLKVLTDLEGVSASLGDVITKNKDAIVRLQAENGVHSAERLRAGAVLKALGAITDPTEGA